MIIAGFAGTGKSTFAARIENAIDLTSIPFSRILPTDECKKEYRRRFVDRGNSDEFIEVFIGK